MSTTDMMSAPGAAGVLPGAAPVGFVEHGVGRCTVREFRRIAEVPADEWDSLVGPDDLQATHRFVRTCEESTIEGAEYRHLMVYRAESLVAVAALSRIDVRLDLLSSGAARRLIQCLRGWRPGFLEVPVVFCGLPVSFGQSLLRFHPAADVPAVLEAVQAAVERFATESGAPVTCFKEFADDESVPLRPLLRHGYLQLPSLPSCRLALPWRAWDDYLRSMRSGYRRQVSATLRSAQRQGLTVSTAAEWGAECPRIFALYEQVMDRAEFQMERLNLAFFERLSTNFADHSSAVLVKQGERLLAAAVLLHSPRLTTFLLAGIDYQWMPGVTAYPLLVTEVVREAIRRGAKALEMGQTSYALKQRLGASPTRRHLFLRYRGALGRPLFRLASGSLFPALEPPPRRVFAEPA